MNELAKEINNIAHDKGWWKNPRETGTILMLMVSELSEACEADRHNKYANRELYESVDDTGRNLHEAFSFESCIKDSFEDELADTVIRILDLCGEMDIDIDWFIKEKIKFNKTRPYKHGNKKY